jgi:hypothetical protein
MSSKCWCSVLSFILSKQSIGLWGRIWSNIHSIYRTLRRIWVLILLCSLWCSCYVQTKYRTLRENLRAKLRCCVDYWCGVLRQSIGLWGGSELISLLKLLYVCLLVTRKYRTLRENLSINWLVFPWVIVQWD